METPPPPKLHTTPDTIPQPVQVAQRAALVHEITILHTLARSVTLLSSDAFMRYTNATSPPSHQSRSLHTTHISKIGQERPSASRALAASPASRVPSAHALIACVLMGQQHHQCRALQA